MYRILLASVYSTATIAFATQPWLVRTWHSDEGLPDKEIASQLGNSVYTVNAHVRRIYEKLHVNTRARAIAKFEGGGELNS